MMIFTHRTTKEFSPNGACPHYRHMRTALLFIFAVAVTPATAVPDTDGVSSQVHHLRRDLRRKKRQKPKVEDNTTPEPPVEVQFDARAVDSRETDMRPFSHDIVLHRSSGIDSSLSVFEQHIARLEWNDFAKHIDKMWDFQVPNLTVEMEKNLSIFSFSIFLDIYELECSEAKVGGFRLNGNIDSDNVGKYKVQLGAKDLSLRCTSRWHYEMTGGGKGTGTMSTDISITSVAATYDLTSHNFRRGYPTASGLTSCAVNGKISNLEIDGSGIANFAGLFESSLEKKLTAKIEDEVCSQARGIDYVAGPINIVFLLQHYFKL